MLLCEQLLLIGLDDEKGGDASRYGMLDSGLAGALLLDLSLAGAVSIEDGNVTATGTADDPLLAATLEAIRAKDRPRGPKHWIGALPRALKPLRGRVAEPLVERGVLREDRSRLLGLIPRTRFPEVDPEPEARLRERLAAVLLEAAEPDLETALLISLLVPLGLVRGLAPRERRREAQRRAERVADRSLVGEDLGRVVKEMQAAVIAAVTAATVAATSN